MDIPMSSSSRFGAVADNPGLGSDCSELYPGLRRIKCGSHLIYYLTSGDVLDVVRILHARRDAEQEF
jgi:toxin ParE1/3/4